MNQTSLPPTIVCAVVCANVCAVVRVVVSVIEVVDRLVQGTSSDMIGPHRDEQTLSELLAEALSACTEHSHDQSCAQGVDKVVIVEVASRQRAHMYRHRRAHVDDEPHRCVPGDVAGLHDEIVGRQQAFL